MHLNSILPPRELSRSAAARDSIDRLRRLQDAFRGSPLDSFSTWEDVRFWLEEIGVAGVASDAVLRPVLIGAKRSPDENWHSILLLLFWRPLVRIRRDLARLDPEPNSLDSNLCWAFLRALHRLDLDRRAAGLGQKILNDVRHDVRHLYAAERALAIQFTPLADEPDDDEAGEGQPRGEILGAPDRAYEEFESKHDARAVRRWLERLVHSGRLSEPDYMILVGCSLYGHPLEEIATSQGLSYEAARKRRQRATKFLQERERKMSPRSDRDPL